MANPSDQDSKKRQDLAWHWIGSAAELQQLTHPDSGAQTFFQRLQHRATARRSEARAREMRHELHSTKRRMEQLSLGADLCEWGVLSGGELENRRVGTSLSCSKAP